jgi:hypothetical protein
MRAMARSDPRHKSTRRERNVDQLRNDIDSGRTGDKVPYPDPAAAPLGTDDEAAGTPPGTERLRRLERGAPGSPGDEATHVGERRRGRDRRSVGWLVSIGIGTVVLALLVLYLIGGF